jgi:hypothetical protein
LGWWEGIYWEPAKSRRNLGKAYGESLAKALQTLLAKAFASDANLTQVCSATLLVRCAKPKIQVSYEKHIIYIIIMIKIIIFRSRVKVFLYACSRLCDTSMNSPCPRFSRQAGLIIATASDSLVNFYLKTFRVNSSGLIANKRDKTSLVSLLSQEYPE